MPARHARAQGTPQPRSKIVVDLPGDVESIDPALAYAPNDWSIVHSIYDAPVQIDDEGAVVPLAAESFAAIDELTWEIVLRPNLAFHDGSPVTSAAIVRSLDHIRGSGSLSIDLFAGIERIDEIDDLTARIATSEPSPWLPAQIAVWLVLLPENVTADSVATAPVGSGPFRFDRYEPGNLIRLVRNEQYTWNSPKGEALANELEYRFVPEASTRIADLASGNAQIVTEIPFDQLPAIADSGALPVEVGIVGSAFIRIATDVPPFDDVRVRQALNLAIDAQEIASALVSTQARRLASIFPDERSIAFDPQLAPYQFDPEQARALLDDAGHGTGIEVALEVTSGARLDIAQAIQAQLGEVGVRVTIEVNDDATFNAGWTDSSRPALRMATWTPLYEPHTLLNLVFSGEGFLSRYANDEVTRLIRAAAVESEPVGRRALYAELAAVMHEDAPAIYLWNLTSTYGVDASLAEWVPRGDDYVLVVSGNGPS